MANRIYTGVSSRARTVSKIYIGVNHVARKVKKAYIGVDGIARRIFSSGLEYMGTLDNGLANVGVEIDAVSVGDYALFGAGSSTNNALATQPTAFNRSLTRILPAVFTQGRYFYTAGKVGSYALFGGGFNGGALRSSVEVYDKSLTKRTSLSFLQATQYKAAATTGLDGDYVLFYGQRGANYVREQTEAFNKNLVKHEVNDSSAYAHPAGTSIGGCALFSGGDSSGYSGATWTNTTVSFDKKLVVNYSVANLRYPRYRHGAATINDKYALFAGGWGTTTASQYNALDTVEVYDVNLVRSNLLYLNTARSAYVRGVNIKNYALFGGGLAAGNDPVIFEMDSYDENLVHTSWGVGGGGWASAAAGVGDYALFGGGYTNSSGSGRTGGVQAWEA